MATETFPSCSAGMMRSFRSLSARHVPLLSLAFAKTTRLGNMRITGLRFRAGDSEIAADLDGFLDAVGIERAVVGRKI